MEVRACGALSAITSCIVLAWDCKSPLSNVRGRWRGRCPAREIVKSSHQVVASLYGEIILGGRDVCCLPILILSPPLSDSAGRGAFLESSGMQKCACGTISAVASRVVFARSCASLPFPLFLHLRHGRGGQQNSRQSLMITSPFCISTHSFDQRVLDMEEEELTC